MVDGIEQLTLGGVVAVLVIREVLDFVRKRNNKKNNKNDGEMRQQLHDLWAWHDVRDEDGTPVWYMKRSLEAAILNLVTEMSTLNVLMREDIKDSRGLRQDIHELVNRKDTM